jgi:hypothetical protein
MEMSKSLLFPNSEKLDAATQAMLTAAYEAACDELVVQHHFSSAQLGGVVEVMITALDDLYRAGQRDEGQLTRYAVSRAVVTARYNGP